MQQPNPPPKGFHAIQQRRGISSPVRDVSSLALGLLEAKYLYLGISCPGAAGRNA